MRETPRPGEVFEGHVIEGQIGRGGMGMVFRARSVALDRPRAIKVIAPELSADPAYAARFRRESRLAASVEHPNVVAVHGAGEDDGLLFIVMRLVEGVDLHRLLEDGPLEPARAVSILRGIAAALDAAHRSGLVHRDVKPANVLIEPRGSGEHVFLTDFGISRATATTTAGGTEREADTALTLEGQVLGTADYVAPEQVEYGTSDARSDVYSLACVAFHALTGQPPFRRDTEIATLIAQTKAERPSASALNPSLPGAVDGPLRDGMAIDPEARPASADALVDRLEAVLGGRPDPTPTDARSRAPTSVMSRPPRAGLRRTWLLAGGVLALAAAAVAVALVLGGGEEEGTSGGETTSTPVVTQRVGDAPVGVAIGQERIWVTVRDQPPFQGAEPGEVQRLFLNRPAQQKEPIALPAPRAVAVGPTSTWVVNGEALYEIGEGDEPLRIEVGEGPGDVAVDSDFVWTANEQGDSVSRVDLDTISSGDPAVETFPVGDEPRSIAVGSRSVWVASAGSETVERINTQTTRVSPPIEGGPQPTSIAVGPSSVWVTDNETSEMWQVDIAGNEVVGEPIPVAASPRGVAVGLSSVWVASGAENVVQRFDAQSGEVTGEWTVGTDPADVAVGIKAVYTANQIGDSVSRFEP